MFRNLYPSLIILALAVGGSYVWLQSDGLNPTTSSDLAAIETIAGVTDVQATDVQVSGSNTADVIEMTLGKANAPITIVEYASFTCPHCALFHETVFDPLVKDYVDTGKVRFVMRDVYFDRFGLWAAMLARCEPTKFFEVSDLIYARQDAWTSGADNIEVVQNLRTLGRDAGLNGDVIDACLQDNTKAQALVEVYQTNSERDDIKNTPAFLINGKKYPNMSLADFKRVIDELLTE